MYFFRANAAVKKRLIYLYSIRTSKYLIRIATTAAIQGRRGPFSEIDLAHVQNSRAPLARIKAGAQIPTFST